MSPFINFNGVFLPSGTAILNADNRGFRYGDGLFETMRFTGGRIVLGAYHFERLLDGMRLLQFGPVPPLTSGHGTPAGSVADPDGALSLTSPQTSLPASPETSSLISPHAHSQMTEKWTAEIAELCRRNGQENLARVRLVVFRGDAVSGSSQGDDRPEYIIQSAPLGPWDREWKGEGLLVGLFQEGRKSCDAFSHLKSNNYLLYSMAARYAQGQGWGDSLVLNDHGRIADSSIANLFYCRQGKIFTPPLSEGGIAGVMRRFLLEMAQKAGFPLEEKATGPEDLEKADEVFLTNSIRGIRRVSRFRQSVYTHEFTETLHRLLLDAIE